MQDQVIHESAPQQVGGLAVHDAHTQLFYDKSVFEAFKALMTAPSVPGRAPQALDYWNERAALLLQRSEVAGEVKLQEELPRAANVSELTERRLRMSSLCQELADIEKKIRTLPFPEQMAKLELDETLLATPDQLIAAFGSAGMQSGWFNSLKDRPWLLAACKRRGKRGVKPLFCPFEVMQGMVHKSKQSRLNSHRGRHLLEQHFPAAYARHEELIQGHGSR